MFNYKTPCGMWIWRICAIQSARYSQLTECSMLSYLHGCIDHACVLGKENDSALVLCLGSLFTIKCMGLLPGYSLFQFNLVYWDYNFPLSNFSMNHYRIIMYNLWHVTCGWVNNFLDDLDIKLRLIWVPWLVFCF